MKDATSWATLLGVWMVAVKFYPQYEWALAFFVVMMTLDVVLDLIRWQLNRMRRRYDEINKEIDNQIKRDEDK